jgi:Na+-transporting NADH:ubiquinone oxidoreductase subunit NqrB
MDNSIEHIANSIAQLASIAVVTACTIVWLRRRSAWILLALLGELTSMCCSLAFTLSPTTLDITFVRLLWPLSAGIFALGLLGYAWFDTADRNAAAPGLESQP